MRQNWGIKTCLLVSLDHPYIAHDKRNQAYVAKDGLYSLTSYGLTLCSPIMADYDDEVDDTDNNNDDPDYKDDFDDDDDDDDDDNDDDDNGDDNKDAEQ